MKKFDPMLSKLINSNARKYVKNILNDLELTANERENIWHCDYRNRRKWEYVSMLSDFLFLGCDREDHLDDDIVHLYINLQSNKQREILVMYLIDWNSIDYVNRERGFLKWEYDKLITLIDPVEKPIGTMVVCARAWLFEVMKWRREFNADDFISVIEYCKWKELDIY